MVRGISIFQAIKHGNDCQYNQTFLVILNHTWISIRTANVELVHLSLCISMHQLWVYRLMWFNVTSFTALCMCAVMHSVWIVMHTLLLECVLHVDCNHFDVVSIA